ncbi:MAG: cytochrome c4 [Rhodanobacter sp.]|jgi:cbb3-type cytochrome c oxidase subunit III|nr:cytochrome c4 [Rhodanobacter sp.]
MSFRHAFVRYLIALTALPGAVFAQAPTQGAQETTPAAATAEPAVAAPAPATATQTSASTAAPAPAATPPAPADNALVFGDAKAGQVKAALCGACHGIDGNPADKQYPKLAGQNEAYIARQITLFKTNMRQNAIMPAFAAALSAQDAHDVGAYFSAQSPKLDAVDDKLAQRGQALYRGGDAKLGVPACMACHGIDGQGMTGTGFPHLAHQWADYVTLKLKDWKNGVTWGDDAKAKIMPGVAQNLSEADIQAVAAYVAGMHTTDATSTAAQ